MNKLLMAMCILFLSACASQTTPPLYYWGDYSNNVYQGMQNKMSAQEQIDAIEQYLEQSRAKNLSVAPGVYAQLGLLYIQTDRLPEAERSFAEEKQRFPESAHFMDFLLRDKTQVKGVGQ